MSAPSGRCRSYLVGALCAVLWVTAARASATPATLEVGSKRFTESYILSELIVQTAARAGPAVHDPGLGNTAILYQALLQHSIDLYPEYLGTVQSEILKDPNGTLSLDEVNARLAPLGLAAGVPFGFQNTYALAMPEASAARLSIRSISDLARHPELRIGVSSEFLGRQDGWPGVARRYGLAVTPQGIDHGLAYEALASHELDVIDIYSTDAKIERYHLRVLTDDLHYFPRYDALLLYRADVPTRLPRQWAAIQGLAGRIDAAAMIGMNAAVELRGRTFAEAAQDFLAGRAGTAAPGSFLEAVFGGDFGRLLAQHLLLVVVSVLAGTAVGVPLGIVAAKVPRSHAPLMGAVGVLQTIPALALLAFLIPLLGRIGTLPALVALFVYSLLPIVRNTAVGLGQVSAGLRDAARALGLTGLQSLVLIEVPLAARVILAGIKTATVFSVGTATIAAFIGAGGFGQRITVGLALNNDTMLLAGAIPAALLALAFEALFEVLDRGLGARATR